MQINVSIITISDRCSRNEREDQSGPALISFVNSLGWSVISKYIIPDDFITIKELLISESSNDLINLILTTGGTGFSPRDNTPEATLSVIQKRTPGLSEKMRIDSIKNNPNGVLSRAESGIIHNCLIINLPGSPKAAVENLSSIAAVLPHAISLITSSLDSESGHRS